jgi:hypothetical protein
MIEYVAELGLCAVIAGQMTMEEYQEMMEDLYNKSSKAYAEAICVKQDKSPLIFLIVVLFFLMCLIFWSVTC